MEKSSRFQYKMVIVIRSDLNMSIGKIVVQACHAAVGCSEEAKRTHIKHWRKWRDEGAKKVALQANCYEELKDLAIKAKNLDLPHILIQDAGHTEVPPGTTTCIGIGPHQEHFINRLTGNYPLL